MHFTTIITTVYITKPHNFQGAQNTNQLEGDSIIARVSSDIFPPTVTVVVPTKYLPGTSAAAGPGCYAESDGVLGLRQVSLSHPTLPGDF